MASIIAAETGMSFREKRAWAALATLTAYIPYFLLGPEPSAIDPTTILHGLGWFAVVSLARGLTFAGLITLITLRTPRADRGRADERDRAIYRRGATAAYYVLIVGSLVAGIIMPFSYQGWAIVNATLLSIVVAEAVNQIATIRAYRRGGNG